MKHRVRIPAFSVLALAGILAAGLSSCSSHDSATASAAAGAHPVSGGSITVAVNGDITCFDPQQSSANITIHAVRQVVDSLTDQDPANLSIHPWLATSWTVNKAATQYVFHLRKGVTFTDGTPFDAQVVKDNFDSIVKDIGPAYGFTAYEYLQNYKDSRVINPYTVEVDFSKPNVSFLQATSTISLAIVSEKTVHTSLADRCQGAIIGSGPFKVSKFNSSVGVTLVKNPAYDWASDLRKHQGPAYLDSIDFEVIPEDDVRSGLQLAGKLDIDTVPDDENIPILQQHGFQVVGRLFPGPRHHHGAEPQAPDHARRASAPGDRIRHQPRGHRE
jgi:peptide/nickel transport system substrate-binding protein